MNKTISVNISGLMFVLDEEAFTRLSQYLRDLRSHFSGREGEQEIISDIESRIAELLQIRLAGQKQVIDLQDVLEVIEMLGQPGQMDEDPAPSTEPKNDDAFEGKEARRLYRDLDNAKLAGVAAGLAHYFRINVLVPRILLIVLIFVSGIGLLLYLLLWLLVPVSTARLENGWARGQRFERKRIRQLFRDPDQKKIAGVSAGLGHYFTIDPLLFRVLFVIFVFVSGIGLIAYLLLWIITPEALSTADKLKMKGRPVNVENIEQTIQEEAARIGRKMGAMGVEAGQGLRNAGRQAGPLLGHLILALARIIAIIVGSLFLVVGLILLVVVTAFVSGWEGFTLFEDFEISFTLADLISLLFTDSGMAQLASVSLGAVLIIPVVMLLYVSLRLITTFTFSLPGLSHIAGVLWVLAIIGLGYSGYKLGSDFKETAKTELLSREINSPKKVFVMATASMAGNRDSHIVLGHQHILFEKRRDRHCLLLMPHLFIEPSAAGERPKLSMEAVAKGEDEALARKRSQKLEYPLEYRNDTLFLPVWFRFETNQGLRSQRINVRLTLPDSSLVAFDPALEDFFNNNPRTFWRTRVFAGRSFMLTSSGLE